MEECITCYYYDKKIYSQQYLKDNKFHRDNFPARIGYFQSGKIMFEEYYFKGKIHRTNGPAYISYHESGNIQLKSYYLNGNLFVDDDIIDNWELFCNMQIFR